VAGDDLLEVIRDGDFFSFLVDDLLGDATLETI
jgi:hypothetical protein